jgi:predicted ArsR family transcriptional regulator
MPLSRSDERFFASTRGQIVTLLRRARRTVDEMASELGLTDNAIRAHLATLERDGLVTQAEPRRGAGKPAFTYELTPEADRLFPNAYGVLLRQLLEVLSDQLPRDAVIAALREVGHRMAQERGAASGPLPQRVQEALAVLADLGGLAEAEDQGDGYVIRGHSCPLAVAVGGSADTCMLAESLLTDIVGLPVRQTCDTGPPPRCRFEVDAAD